MNELEAGQKGYKLVSEKQPDGGFVEYWADKDGNRLQETVTWSGCSTISEEHHQQMREEHLAHWARPKGYDYTPDLKISDYLPWTLTENNNFTRKANDRTAYVWRHTFAFVEGCTYSVGYNERNRVYVLDARTAFAVGDALLDDPQYGMWYTRGT